MASLHQLSPSYLRRPAILHGNDHIFGKHNLRPIVKSENILISPLVHMTISDDFGLAWTSSDHSMPFDTLNAHALAGTFGHYAPEVLDSRRELDGYDCFVDIFSLGLVFLELFKSLSGVLERTENSLT